jgi:hypothetical protein
MSLGADFEGGLRVGGISCHPLTISDGDSRCIVRCHALDKEAFAPA